VLLAKPRFADGARPSHFFGLAFFTANFMALLFPRALAAW